MFDPLDGLDEVPWATLTHTVGSAADVPDDLRRIAASEPEAVHNLGALVDLGELSLATAAAVPFLVRLARCPIADRGRLCRFLASIAEHSSPQAEKIIREGWAWKKRAFGETFPFPAEEMANRTVAVHRASADALRREIPAIEALSQDADPEVAAAAARIRRFLG